MKMSMHKKLIVLLGVCSFLFFSCAPLPLCHIEYLGDSYAPSSSVEVFYDAKQVKREYKLMGRMTRCTTTRSERTKKLMIELAKRKGADGIIFLNTVFQIGQDQGDGIINAQVIKFL